MLYLLYAVYEQHTAPPLFPSRQPRSRGTTAAALQALSFVTATDGNPIKCMCEALFAGALDPRHRTGTIGKWFRFGNMYRGCRTGR